MALKTGLLLNRSRQVPAEDTPAFGGIAERFRRAGDLDRAITLCREGLRKFPTLLSARVTLGWALLDKGEYDEARGELEQVLRRAPDNLAAIRGLAELHDRTDHLRSSHHDDEQDIDLASLTAAIEEEERVAAGVLAPDVAARQPFAELVLEQPAAMSFETLDDGAVLSQSDAGDEISLTEFEVAPPAVFDQRAGAADARSIPTTFEVADVVLTSPSDFAAEASTANANFYAADPVVLALASEPTAPPSAPATSFHTAPAAFAFDEPVPSEAFDLAGSQGLDPVIEATEPATLSLGPLDREEAALPFEVAPAVFSEPTSLASIAADIAAHTATESEHEGDLVTLPAGGELEFDDLSLAIGALGLEAAALDPVVTDTLLDEHLGASAAVDVEHSRPVFDDVAPVLVPGTLAPPDMAGVFDHDFGLAAERAEESHDYDLPEGDATWSPERDVRLAAFSSMADGFNDSVSAFDDQPLASDGSGESNVLAMATRTPIPKFSTAGLERLLRQVQARRVALATSSVA